MILPWAHIEPYGYNTFSYSNFDPMRQDAVDISVSLRKILFQYDPQEVLMPHPQTGCMVMHASYMLFLQSDMV
jgi:hypothetical protein